MTSPSWTSQPATLGSHFPSQVKWTSWTTWSRSPLPFYVLWGLLICFYLGLGSSRVLDFCGHTPLAGYKTQLHFSFSILLNLRDTALPSWESGPPPSSASPILWLHLSYPGLGASAPLARSQLYLFFHSTYSSSLILSVFTAPSIL